MHWVNTYWLTMYGLTMYWLTMPLAAPPPTCKCNDLVPLM
jgi:hypothetical protein